MIKKFIVDIFRTLQRERVFLLVSFLAFLVILGAWDFSSPKAWKSF